MKKFTIERATWARGQNARSPNFLLSEDGMRCCVGFFGQQIIGLSDEDMLEIGGLCSIRAESPNNEAKLAPFLIGIASDTTLTSPPYAFPELPQIRSLYEVNDMVLSKIGTEEAREARIKELFAELGYEVEFV